MTHWARLHNNSRRHVKLTQIRVRVASELENPCIDYGAVIFNLLIWEKTGTNEQLSIRILPPEISYLAKC